MTLNAQGASEFCEVEVLSCAQHKNLVMLVGYCIEIVWFLVYEFACNGSLDKHLYVEIFKLILILSPFTYDEYSPSEKGLLLLFPFSIIFQEIIEHNSYTNNMVSRTRKGQHIFLLGPFGIPYK